MRRRYADRLSGPIRDRVDVHRVVQAVARHQVLDQLARPEPTPAGPLRGDPLATQRRRPRWRAASKVAAGARGHHRPARGSAPGEGERPRHGPHRAARVDGRLADVKALVYVRQSQDRRGEELGVTRQREDCERLAELRGWQITEIHVDNDTSAAGKRRRPAFEAVLAALERGSAEAVVAWSLDRLTRNRRDQLRLVETCEKAGTVVALVRGSDIDMTTPAGRLVADVLGSVARHEIEQKSDRQRRAAQQAAYQGRRVGGRRPFGYDDDGVTVRPVEAVAVRAAYTALLTGSSLGSVARDWNARGLPTPQGHRDGTPSGWSSQTVSRTLRKPSYAGLRAHRGEIVGAANWPALVDEETWRAAQAVLTDPARRSPGGERALLTGIALCGVCGATLHAGGAAGGYRMYRCSGSRGHVGRMAQPIEDYVSAVVVARLTRPDAAGLMAVIDERPNAAALRRDADTLRLRLEQVAIEFADGALTAQQLRAATERLRTRLAVVEQELAVTGRVNLLKPLVGAGDVSVAWQALPVERQRAVIDLLMTVTVQPAGRGTRTFRRETVQVRWRQA